MEVNGRFLDKEVLKANKRYTIPIYQRNYSWTIKQCTKLIENILSLDLEENKKTYFMGTFVLSRDNEKVDFSYDTYEVIDGQQRMITFSLLIKALYDSFFYVLSHKDKSFLDDLNLEGKKRSLNFELNEYILLHNQEIEKQEKIKNLKLILSGMDNDTFSNIIYEDFQLEEFSHDLDSNLDKNILENKFGKIDTGSNLYKNYKAMYSKFTKIFNDTVNFDSLRAKFDELRQKIQKMNVIVIIIGNDENPQLIFESINSTGISLMPVDLIRNYLLMSETSSKQRELYKNDWVPIEKCVGDVKDLNEIFAYFICLKTGSKPNDKILYDKFKLLFKESAQDKSSLLKEVRDIVFIYMEIKKGENNYYKELSKFKMTQFYPLIVATALKYQEEKINSRDFEKLINLYTNYFLRRSIINFQTGSLNSFLSKLAKEIYSNGYISKNGNLHDFVLLKILDTGSTKKAFFPTDEDIKNAQAWRNFYDYDNSKHILKSIESYESQDPLILSRKYTIEHIMPQTLTSEWKRDLGENFKEVHETLIHSIGNLTLITDNSELGNKPFEIKKTFLWNFAVKDN